MHISRLSPAEIAHDLAESLERLQADSIDLYWLHRDDPAVPVGEIMDALHAHLAAGRVRAIGASNWTPARLDAAAAYARARGLASFCASQIGWSLAQANPEMIGQNGMLYMDTGTLEYHRRSGLPVMAYSSQGQGFFSGKYARSLLTARGQATATEAMAHLYFSEANFARLERAQALAAQAGVTANQIALAYLLSQPFPVYPIVGCRTVEQVRASCAASGLQLDEGEVAWLEGNNP
jgi:aryl-alcohol dehydrogenase-like predicted oxidoreductase